MKYATIIALLSILSMPFAFAINVNIEPIHPKKGETVKVYAILNNESNNVKLEYCVGDACFFTDMHYENGKWIGNFTMPANNIELKIIADGNIVWEKEIKEKKTPGFEFIFATIAILFILFKRKWI